jgi:nucleotide-binding universal stress UspA family protein
MTHVLVPVDDSKRAREAFEFALDEHADAEITVLHVISPTTVIAVSEPSVWDDQLAEQTQREAEELLAEMRNEANARDIDVRTEIVHGNAPQAIVEYAGEYDVDHIVLGSHGRTGFSRVLLGSVAETVVRRAPVPVTVIR